MCADMDLDLFKVKAVGTTALRAHFSSPWLEAGGIQSGETDEGLNGLGRPFVWQTFAVEREHQKALLYILTTRT